jgi:sigma-B regulation protein RsbU (phosphoserine phosphatase)
MEAYSETGQRRQLLARRRKLHDLIASGNAGDGLPGLLELVDAALERLDTGCYGRCKVCSDPIEQDLLRADPLVELCLDHLTPGQARALESDLELAARLQREMLPPRDLALPGLETAYHYQGAGLVSGDYCDLISPDGATLYFIMGDVTGKGYAASLLMSHLHATFLSLLTPGADLVEVLLRANRIFCESSLATHFATLFCGRIDPQGVIEYCLAGHPPPMVLRGGEVSRLEAAGLPLGMFCQQTYALGRRETAPGDLILLFSDGVTETVDPRAEFYGEGRLVEILRPLAGAPARDVVEAVRADLDAFRAGAAATDDVAIMAIRRSG